MEHPQRHTKHVIIDWFPPTSSTPFHLSFSLYVSVSLSLFMFLCLFVSVAFSLSPLSNYFNHCAEMEEPRILCIRINTRYIRMYFWCTWFTRMPRETYCRPLGSLLCLCDVFWTLINSLVCQSIAQNNASLATADVQMTTSSSYHFSPPPLCPCFCSSSPHHQTWCVGGDVFFNE